MNLEATFHLLFHHTDSNLHFRRRSNFFLRRRHIPMKKTVIREMRNEKSWERGKWKKSEKRKSGESMSDESVKVFIVWKEKWKESTELRKYSHEFMTHKSHAKKIEKPVVVSQIHIYSVWFIITFSNINLLLKIIINET